MLFNLNSFILELNSYSNILSLNSIILKLFSCEGGMMLIWPK